jgi:hypothetical protein
MNLYDYTFTYVDKKNNVLKESILPCFSKKESLQIANKLLAESMINSLSKIKTRKKCI